MRTRSSCAEARANGRRDGELGAVALEMAIVTPLLLLLIVGALTLGSAVFARHLLLEAASSVTRVCALRQLRDSADCDALAQQCRDGGFSPACRKVYPWCDDITATVEAQSQGEGTAGPQLQWMTVNLTCTFTRGAAFLSSFGIPLARLTASALMPYSLQPQGNR